jgi:release factor glutamine methyltransferase
MGVSGVDIGRKVGERIAAGRRRFRGYFCAMRTADNRVRTLVGLYGTSLTGLYGTGEVKAILRAVFDHALGWDAAQLELRRDDALSESELVKVYTPLQRLQLGEPLQYVLGKVHFHGVELEVAPGVLIPRPETEELVQLIIEEELVPTRIVDIGTGSGCIALALKRAFPNASVMAIDSSEEALTIARRSAERNGLEVEWIHADVLDPSFALPPADLIVSNPPYVPRSEEASLSPQVRDFEPHLALFVEDNDPLLFYHVIAKQAIKVLPAGGRLFFEGHYIHATAVEELLWSMDYREVSLVNDLSGNARFISAER